jgi:hypothetical protein
MPKAVSETGPRDFLRECSGRSESEMSLSMDLVAKIWRGRCEVLVVLKIATIVCGSDAAGESAGRWKCETRPLDFDSRALRVDGIKNAGY